MIFMSPFQVSILGDTQRQSGHGPKQPARGEPVLSREGWTSSSPDVLSNLNHFTFL